MKCFIIRFFIYLIVRVSLKTFLPRSFCLRDLFGIKLLASFFLYLFNLRKLAMSEILILQTLFSVWNPNFMSHLDFLEFGFQTEKCPNSEHFGSDFRHCLEMGLNCLKSKLVWISDIQCICGWRTVCQKAKTWALLDVCWGD